MDARSSALFRSNIYPTSTKGELANDRKFLDAISDPEALDILWRYNGSEGAKLNALQRRQHDMAKHCRYAEEGVFPWGTPVGSNRVVCLCERTDCPLYARECSKFHPEGFTPIPGRDHAPTPSEVKKGTTKPKRRVRMVSAPKATGTKRPDTRVVTSTPSFGNQNRTPTHKVYMTSNGSVAGRRGPTRSRRWSAREDAILIEMYPIFGMSLNRWNKKLIDRSPVEILDRAHELNVRYVPEREREMRRAEPKVQTNKPKKSGSAQEKAAKKAHREAMRRRPWDSKEDDILRRMYPLYGADMILWSEKLKYRTKLAIEARAKQLGL